MRVFGPSAGWHSWRRSATNPLACHNRCSTAFCIDQMFLWRAMKRHEQTTYLRYGALSHQYSTNLRMRFQKLIKEGISDSNTVGHVRTVWACNEWTDSPIAMTQCRKLNPRKASSVRSTVLLFAYLGQSRWSESRDRNVAFVTYHVNVTEIMNTVYCTTFRNPRSSNQFKVPAWYPHLHRVHTLPFSEIADYREEVQHSTWFACQRAWNGSIYLAAGCGWML